MKRTIMIALLTIGCAAFAQTVTKPMRDLYAWEILWIGFMHVDDMEMPEPPGAESHGYAYRPSIDSMATGGGTRFLKKEVRLSDEGAKTATRLIRAAMHGFFSFEQERMKDHCANHKMPTDPSEFAAYLENEARLQSAKKQDLIADMLNALSEADRRAFGQWAFSGRNFTIGQTGVDENLEEHFNRAGGEAHVRMLIGEMCDYPV
jgi:hypothetical protein